MKRVFAVSTMLAVLVLTSTSTALAGGKPIRLYAPLPSQFVISGSCSFDVTVEVLRNNEFTTTFNDSAGNPVRAIVTGALVLRLTNPTSARSVVVNVSGPTMLTFNPDGSTVVVGRGNGLVVLPGRLFLQSGSVTVLFTADGQVQLISTSGRQTDACALLQ